MTEVIVSAKTVDAAVELGANQLGTSAENVKYEVIEEAKKGLFGFGSSDAKVRVYTDGCKACESAACKDEDSPEGAALCLLNTIINDMGINARAKIANEETVIPEGKSIPERTVYIEIEGEGLGSLIGRHGDVLDSLQYLANIAAGRKVKGGEDRKEYIKICLDIENYREKREETLKALARRMADKAIKYHRNLTLEPMLAYERKIIHAELQNYEGVFTYSVGSDSDRKVVIALGTPENPIKPRHDRNRSYSRRNSYSDSYSSDSSYSDYSDEEE